VKAVFPEFDYVYFLPQRSTKFGTNKTGGNAILSKLPIESHECALIQTDPGGDKWERKAQYVRIFIGFENQYLNLFHYHNTYNWHNNNSQSEKSGLEKFQAFVLGKNVSESEMIVLMGDFNLSATQSDQILSVDLVPNSQSNWVDYIYTNAIMELFGVYPTADNSLSAFGKQQNPVSNVSS